MNPPPEDRQTVPYRRILWIVIALILYGSLYPWRFYERSYGRDPLTILLHSWPAHFDRYVLWDTTINITLYLPLGLFAFLAIDERATRALRMAVPLAIGTVLSASIEMLQLYDDGRQCSLDDLAANVVGTAVGVSAGVFYQGQLRRFLDRHGTAALLRPTGSLLLIACWLGYQLFPLFPAWGRTHLLGRIVDLKASALAPAGAFVVCAEWLAVACMLSGIRRSKSTGTMALLLLLVPLRLLIASRTLAWPDVIGALVAFGIWTALPLEWTKRAAPVVVTIALIVVELAPFRWAPQPVSQRFDWVPFRALFHTTWQGGFVMLFRKSFWYGSVLWMWRASGRSLLWITALVAAVLLFLERVQVYLPGRTPEITDSVLAVLMGLLLWLLSDA